MQTRLMLFLRAGSGSLHRSWTHVCAGRVDIVLSIYDDAAIDPAGFIAVHRSRGGKFRGFADFLRANPAMAEAYTHFWLFEDDLYLPFDSLLAVQDMLERFRFVLCAPSLAPESFVSWPITVRNPAFALRATNFVEIMAPIMSRAFLDVALPYFADNHSGWGHEWMWQHLLERRRGFAAILDAAPVVHTRPIGAGTLYVDDAGNRIDGVAEAEALFARHGLDPNRTPFRNHFGLRCEDHAPMLGSDFLIGALGGCAVLAGTHPQLHERCVEFLTASPRAVATLAEALAFEGAVRLLSAAP